MVRTRDRPGQGPGAIGIDVRTQWQRDHTGARRDADEPRGDRHRGRPRVGLEITRTLSGRGFAVVLSYSVDQAAAEAAVEEVLAADGVALAVRADVADELDVARLFTETTEAFAEIDVVADAASRLALGHDETLGCSDASSGPICRARSSSIDRRRVVRPGTIVNLCVEQFGAPTSAAGLGKATASSG